MLADKNSLEGEIIQRLKCLGFQNIGCATEVERMQRLDEGGVIVEHEFPRKWFETNVENAILLDWSEFNFTELDEWQKLSNKSKTCAERRSTILLFVKSHYARRGIFFWDRLEKADFLVWKTQFDTSTYKIDVCGPISLQTKFFVLLRES